MDKILNLYFSPTGRIGRLSFFLGLLGFWLLIFILLILNYFVLGSASAQTLEGMEFVLTVMAAVVFLVITYAAFVLHIKRLHDLDHSGWWVLILIIPIIHLLFFIYLLFFKGTAGPNRFGNSPVE